MRGLLLLLPVILVIIIVAGSGQAEEEVGEKQVEGLPLEEKAEISLERDAREAGNKKDNGKGTKESKKAKLKNRQRKPKRAKGDGDKKQKTDLKKKNNKGTRKNNQKDKNNQGAKKEKSNKNISKKKKKGTLTRKEKRQRNKKKGNKSTRKNGSNKKGDNKEKRKRNKKNRTNKQVKKTKTKKKNRKSKPKKSVVNGRQTPPVWSDWSSCSKSGVNDSCILNAVNSLNFEKNQIQSFMKQKARLTNQNKTTGKKLGKKGEFSDAARYLLIALGGNITTASCGERESSKTSRNTTNTRAMDVAKATYTTLMNCSVTIRAGCSMPDTHINQTFLDECEVVYKKSKAFSEDCRSNTAYVADGSQACLCWEKAAKGIAIAKDKGCTKASQSSAKKVKNQKATCLKAFGVCKKAEDAAIALVHTCMAGEINTVPHRGEGRF